MAYKKYIKKNGKLYGPYTYHSRRIDGKVVSEYHGKNENNFSFKSPKIISRNLVLALIGAFLLIMISLFVYNVSINNLTGNVALDLKTKYLENENLKGNFILKLKEGELVPSDSKIIINTTTQNYEYLLSDLTSEEPATGDFYIENSVISGSGQGYGKEGIKEISQDLSFILEISSEKKADDEIPTKETETQTETPTETETQTEETPTETPTETETPITGNIVSGFLRSISNFFLGLNPSRGLTGQVSLNVEDTIDGEVSIDKPFTYTLNDGQVATIKKSSVKIKSSGEEIDEKEIIIDQNENTITITTEYVGEEKGFGKEYLTEEIGEELIIDLEVLNIPAEKGVLMVSVLHEGESIVSVSKELDVEGETIVTSNETSIFISSSSFALTQEENDILSSTFENLTIKTTKALTQNERLRLRYQLDKYWIEYSYDYDGNLEKISDIIERDKSRWLKDIAKELLKEKSDSLNVDELINKEFNLSSIKIVSVTSNITKTEDLKQEEDINKTEENNSTIESIENVTTETNESTNDTNSTIINNIEVSEDNSTEEINVSS